MDMYFYLLKSKVLCLVMVYVVSFEGFVCSFDMSMMIGQGVYVDGLCKNFFGGVGFVLMVYDYVCFFLVMENEGEFDGQ